MQCASRDFDGIALEARGSVEAIMITNLLADVPANLPEELFVKLLDAGNVRIEKIVSHGHASPEGFWYDQEQHEWVVVLRGAARLSIEDEIKELKPGDFILISAHQKHRVEWTTPMSLPFGSRSSIESLER